MTSFTSPAKLSSIFLLGLLAHCSGEVTPSRDDTQPGNDANSTLESAEDVLGNHGLGGFDSDEPHPSPDSAAAAGRWQDIADFAYREALIAEGRLKTAGVNIKPLWQAQLAWYAARTFGWNSNEATARRNELLKRRLPSNGWGLGEAWRDDRGNVLREAGTTYAITTAWHVGRYLLAGFDAGVISQDYVVAAAHTLLNFPRVPGHPDRCIAYSSSGYDQTHTGCVYNIEVTAAWYLWEVQKRGLISSSVLDTVRAWRDDTAEHFNPSTGIWPYSNISLTPQDPWHNGPVVWTLLQMRPDKGEPGLIGQFNAWPASGGNAQLLTSDCARRNSQYEATYASARQGCYDEDKCNTQVKRDLVTIGSRTAYVVDTSMIQEVCGD